MTVKRVLSWLSGATAILLALTVIGCEDEDEQDISNNPPVPAGVRVTRGEDSSSGSFSRWVINATAHA